MSSLILKQLSNFTMQGGSLGPLSNDKDFEDWLKTVFFQPSPTQTNTGSFLHFFNLVLDRHYERC